MNIPRSSGPRRLARPWLALGALCGLLPVLATAADLPAAPRHNPQTFTLLFENDLFGDTDQQYTNGLKLAWLSPDLKALAGAPGVPPWLLALVQRLNAFEARVVDDDSRQFNLGVAIGQMIYTPEDTERVSLVRDDRPYAGWLYGALAFVSKTDRVADTLEIQGGMVGPASLAEQAQRFVHDLRDLDEPRGWDNQLSNEPGVVVYYERKWRLLREEFFHGLGYDFIVHGGVALGNVATYGAGGGEARFGWRLPQDFGTSLIRPGGDTSAPTLVGGAAGRARGFGVYGFAAVAGRVVGRDIFLDGNTFEDSHDVDKENLVGDVILGASVVFGAGKLSYAQVFRSRQFEGQQRRHNFGSVSLSLSF